MILVPVIDLKKPACTTEILRGFRGCLVSREGVVEYFVKGKGYPDKFNSWVAESDISKL